MPYINSPPYVTNLPTLAASADGKPTAPHNLRLSSVSDSSIGVSWNNGEKQTSVEIESRDSTGTWSALATLGANIETYTDTGLSGNTARGYRVRGVNAEGNGPWSNVVVDATTESGSVLPTDYWFQRVLRAFIGSFSASDFDVTLSSITDVTGSMTDEEVWNAWCVNDDRGFDSPRTEGFRAVSADFTLANIESGSVINMRIGRGGWVTPDHTAFYAFWDNPLNIHYDNANIYKRALVINAVDMIMTIDYFDNNPVSIRSDFIGGYFLRWGRTHWMYKNHGGTAQTSMDVNTEVAMLAALRNQFDRIKDRFPGGNGGTTLEMHQLAGLPYLYNLGVITLEEYETRANFVVSEISNPGGGKGVTHDHAGGTVIGNDMSYEGIAQSFMAEAAIAEHFLLPDHVRPSRGYIERSADFLAHIIVIEHSRLDDNIGTTRGENTLMCPTAFNVASNGRVASQWPHEMREWESNYAVPNRELNFRVHGYHNRVYFICQKAVRTRDDMINSWGLSTWINNMNNPTGANGNNFVGAVDTGVVGGEWDGLRYWNDRLPGLVLFGVTGYYTDILAQTSEQLTLPPVLRTGDFTKNYAHTGVAKLGNLVTSAHYGPTSPEWSGNPSSLRGGLGAFYIKDKAIFILSCGTGGQGSPPDTWSTHDTWAVNTISGTTVSGEFSESRNSGEELRVKRMDAIGRTMVLTDTFDFSTLYKFGDRITLEDWTTGDYHVLTIAEDSVYNPTDNELTVVVKEEIPKTDIAIVHNSGAEIGNDYFIFENRALVDSTIVPASVDGATIDRLVVKRTISGKKSEEKTTVDVEFTSEGQEAITDMWEQIPIFQGYQHVNFAMTANIEYWNDNNSEWTTLSTSYVSTDKLRLTRDLNRGAGNQFAYITFENKEEIKLNSATVSAYGNGQLAITTRNIQIKVSDTNIRRRHKLTYYLQETDPS